MEFRIHFNIDNVYQLYHPFIMHVSYRLLSFFNNALVHRSDTKEVLGIRDSAFSLKMEDGKFILKETIQDKYL